MWGLSQNFLLPFMFAQPLLLSLPKTAKLVWHACAPEESCTISTSAIGLQCANRWHLRTQDWWWRGCSLYIVLLSTLHVTVSIRNGLFQGMAPAKKQTVIYKCIALFLLHLYKTVHTFSCKHTWWPNHPRADAYIHNMCSWIMGTEGGEETEPLSPS